MLTSDTIIHFKRNPVNSITKVPASYVVLQVHYLLVSYLSSVDIVQPPQGLRTTHKHINICLICLLHHLSHWCCITREGLGAYYISSRLAWHLLNSGLTLHGLPIKIVQRIFTVMRICVYWFVLYVEMLSFMRLHNRPLMHVTVIFVESVGSSSCELK